jgi:hypothetical protein
MIFFQSRSHVCFHFLKKFLPKQIPPLSLPFRPLYHLHHPPFAIPKSNTYARTYGIPTISKLLCQTQQLAEPQYASRRYEDTTVLIAEFIGHSPTSERANSAIARMNYLHGLYQKSGKISNDDMLYTLSLFVLEVERWIRLYEWRQMTDMEICAL